MPDGGLAFEIAGERPWTESRLRVERERGQKGGPREEEHNGYHVEYTGRTRRGAHVA